MPIQYIGDTRPAAKIYAYPDARINKLHSFTSDNNIDYRLLQAGARVLEIPNISTITINKDMTSDAATCTINVDDPTGALNPVPTTGTWSRVLCPNTLLTTFQGYGVPALDKTGTWLIDKVTFSNPPNVITIQCRDLMKLLIDQTLYPPIIPNELYPIGFCTPDSKQTVETYRKANRWIPYADLSEVVKCFFRIAGFNQWNVESTGVMVPLEEMSQIMLIDAINRIKEIVGYRLWVDKNGIPHFEHAPISGTTIPRSQYMIHQATDIEKITRSIGDTMARSKIIVYGKTLGGVGNVNVVPARNIKRTEYTKRFIHNKYCFAYQSGQDWLNFKNWVCHMAPGDVDSWGGSAWIPSGRRGSGANYYGMRCYHAVKAFQKANAKACNVWSHNVVRGSSHLGWSDEYIRPLGRGRHLIRVWEPHCTIGNFYGDTKSAWNRLKGYGKVPHTVTDHIPGYTEIDFDPLTLVSATVSPLHWLIPLHGQVRIAVHNDVALENTEQCKRMAEMIDFWANVENNQFTIDLRADNRYDAGHIADLFETGTNTYSKILILGTTSIMDLDSGQWSMSLEVVDIDPEEHFEGIPIAPPTRLER